MGKLDEENGDRPSVGNDVVHGENQQVFFWTNLHQHSSKQRTASQIERLFPFLTGNPQSFSFALTLWQMFHVDDGNGHIDVGQYDLFRLAFDAVENGTEHFMTPDKRADGGS